MKSLRELYSPDCVLRPGRRLVNESPRAPFWESEGPANDRQTLQLTYHSSASMYSSCRGPGLCVRKKFAPIRLAYEGPTFFLTVTKQVIGPVRSDPSRHGPPFISYLSINLACLTSQSRCIKPASCWTQKNIESSESKTGLQHKSAPRTTFSVPSQRIPERDPASSGTYQWRLLG
jgi:hypothetical protein